MPKWDFLAVYDRPLKALIEGSVAGLHPRTWQPNLVTDPVQMAKQQGPTLNQYIGGTFAEYAYSGLQGFLSHDHAREAFLLALDKVNEPHMGPELLSGTYERYYVAAAAAGWVVSREFGDAQVGRECRRFLENHQFLLGLHKSPIGIATPGARMTLGSHLKDRQWTYSMLTTAAVPRELIKKPKRWWDHHFNCGLLALSKAGTIFAPKRNAPRPKTAWPIRVLGGDNGQWLSVIPEIRSYDPCYATSYVDGRLHELRYLGRKTKDEYPRKNRARLVASEGNLTASLPEIGWNSSIPVPSGINIDRILF